MCVCLMCWVSVSRRKAGGSGELWVFDRGGGWIRRGEIGSTRQPPPSQSPLGIIYHLMPTHPNKRHKGDPLAFHSFAAVVVKDARAPLSARELSASVRLEQVRVFNLLKTNRQGQEWRREVKEGGGGGGLQPSRLVRVPRKFK